MRSDGMQNGLERAPRRSLLEAPGLVGGTGMVST